jgi:hypothetical protein
LSSRSSSSSLFTLGYGLTGSVVGDDRRSISFCTLREPGWDLVSLALFSLPEGLHPRNDFVQLVAGFQALLSITLIGLLGFVLGNRIRRS